MTSHILVATTGSLGDLHPMLAVATELEAAGALVTVATSPRYRHLWTGPGRRFAAIGSPAQYVEEICYRAGMSGTQALIDLNERLHFDQLEQLYEDLLRAAADADVLVSPVHLVQAHLVAEKRGIPFIACALSPTQIEAHEAPGDEAVAWRAASIRCHAAIEKLRQAQGLPRKILPYSSTVRAAAVVLGLFPKFLRCEGRPVVNVDVMGHARFREAELCVPDEELAAFCDSNTVAFSFGSFVDASRPGYFARESVAACRRLGLKCLYISRYVSEQESTELRGGDVLIRDYVAHDLVFPSVGAVVHHGGMGTLASACRHLKPMLIVPFFLDQPEHASRMRALGAAAALSSKNYQRDAVSDALAEILKDRDKLARRLEDLMSLSEDGSAAAARRILTFSRQSSIEIAKPRQGRS
jgi:rhamnosyltransferase subunit B